MADRVSVSHITDDMVGAGAEVLLADYQSEYSGGEVNDFVILARRVLEAAQAKGVAAGCAAKAGALVSPEQTTDHATPSVSPVTDDMVRRAAEAMEDEAVTRLGRDLGTVHRDAIAKAALEAALAGCAVVDRPEPSRAEHNEDATVWRVGKLEVEAWRGQVALLWGTDGDGGDGENLTATRARELAAALVAAADEHERRGSQARDQHGDA